MSVIEHRPANVGLQFFARVHDSSDDRAYGYPSGDGLTWVTWGEVGARVEQIAAGLVSYGLDRGDRCGIISTTRYEWVLADMAIMSAGMATTTVYPSTHADDMTYILTDADVKIVFAEDQVQLDKLIEKRAELPHVAKVVMLADGATGVDGDWVISLADLESRGMSYLAEHPGAIQKICEETPADALATLIYTSGTTGKPKGVRLHHGAWTYEGTALNSMGIFSKDDLQYLWLPLAHSFGKVLLSSQFSVGFPTVIDGRVEKIIENMEQVKPTFMGAAPRIFEKAHGRIVTMQEEAGGAKKKIFDKAFEVGRKVYELNEAGRKVPFLLKAQLAVFDKLVFAKIRDRFGGRTRFLISGSAALNRDIATWFEIAGLRILEGYGLTETSAGTCVNLPWDNRIGTVGPPFPGSEVMIADDGEILIRGEGVMEGYHNLPDATAEVFSEGGWFHTGDIGEIDADGYVKITDRKKDLFKTSGGKYIAPSQIEAMFKAVCPYASQFVVHGNERNYCVALITLDADAMAGWAAQNGMEGASYSEIVTSDAVEELVSGYVDDLNLRLNRWETIKKFRILDQDLSVESGELTPSLKMKRRIVEERNRELLDGMYD
ncbi:MAG: long-chain fatty acid--CoA ligase [Ilumatobacter coccineus]|uniref:Long-chain fatty acid--CoA ligase n=1 Tax=Ilumatobacter coccineus TaxID=467094 RepID=A0A2G6KEQ9_9ACTN|nr:MAG: long-chain fatty acid--CoA ligase [Ilumatobacter coccineus]